ncbi:MAG: DPP IV N-terminal domain-containing protein, partial [Planctomycetes bacterium]|nr:DPP IV N-terminal domain-containing protein [Planctomycetota bacterium]
MTKKGKSLTMRLAAGLGVGVVAIAISITAPLALAQEVSQAEREAMYHRYLEFPSLVKGGSIEPHWMVDGSSFWYAEGALENTIIYQVDPKANTKTLLFDTARLRQALAELLGHEPPYQGLPFDKFDFVDEGEQALKFTVKDKEFILQLNTYTIMPAPTVSEEEQRRLVPQITRKGAGYPDLDLMEIRSPDGRWFVFLKDRNVWLRSTADGKRVQLTTDGKEGYEWRDVPVRTYSKWASWSPNSSKLALKNGDYRKVPKIPIVDYLSPTEEVRWISYSRAGEPIPQTELFILDILSKKLTRVETGLGPNQYALIVGWRSDGSELLFYRVDRYWEQMDLMGADPATGRTRLILTESHPEFALGQGEKIFTQLNNGDQFIWMSQRDGWYHLYLYDMTGKLIRRLTKGTFPVMEVVAVDEERGWVYFTARAEKRLYDTHLYRINLQGNNFTRLTEGTGQHEIEFAPSTEFFLDTHSNVDRPPAVELRRADGKLLQVLSRAKIDALVNDLKWRPPEEFVVKAADGTTDLYGVLFKPHDFDPQKKYPVIDQIYGGLSIVPHSFTRGWWARAFAQLGFIVFLVDNRGTDGRGREFSRSTSFAQLGRHEIPDHVATLKQLAESRPYMDLERVGLFGYSHGGYMAIRGMLL